MQYVVHEPKNIRKVISDGSSIMVYETIGSEVINKNVMDKKYILIKLFYILCLALFVICALCPIGTPT
jgi:hypothetical protein